eukprot:UN29345
MEGLETLNSVCNRFAEMFVNQESEQRKLINFTVDICKVITDTKSSFRDGDVEDSSRLSAQQRYKMTQTVTTFCSVIQTLLNRQKTPYPTNGYFELFTFPVTSNIFSILLSNFVTLLHSLEIQKNLTGKNKKNFKLKKSKILTGRIESFQEQNMDKHCAELPKYRKLLITLLKIQLNFKEEIRKKNNISIENVLNQFGDIYSTQGQHRNCIRVILLESMKIDYLIEVVKKGSLVRKLIHSFKKMEEYT